MTQPHDSLSPLDQATAGRLKQLASRPVDTSSLQGRLLRELDLPRPQAAGLPPRWRRVSVWSGIAAMVAVLVTLALWPGQGPRVEAGVLPMYQLRQDMLDGRLAVTPTGDAALVRQILAARQPVERVVATLPQAVAAACCLRRDNHTAMLGLLWQVDGQEIAIAISDDHAMVPGESQGELIVGGRRFVTHARDGVNMAMTTQDGRAICFMGPQPTETLAAHAARLLDSP